MTTIAFFNNKGGVGKTSLVYHLGWAFSQGGKSVLMVDLDPQSNLTAMCVNEEQLEQLWPDVEKDRKSIRGTLQPIVEGTGDIQPAHLEYLTNRLALIPGDIQLSGFEQRLSDAWPRAVDRDPAAFRVVSSFHRVIETAAREHEAELVLIDVGPNVGAINRSALIAAEYVVTPLGADLFSIQGLRNLGPTLRQWRLEWSDRLARKPPMDIDLPAGRMQPMGYVVMQPNLYGGRVTKAYERWLREIPEVYASTILERPQRSSHTVQNDPCALAILRHYRSLMPLAQDKRKPIFLLTSADGAIGAHAAAVQEVGASFRDLTAA
ncbi:ParA family protein, partial [Myxococcota bacterium]